MNLCCKEQETCKNGCPFSHHFGRTQQDAGGFYPRIPLLKQEHGNDHPLYLPMIHHRSARSQSVQESIVALPTWRVVALRRHRPHLTAVELRQFFRVPADARIVLISVSQDSELEKMWRDMLVYDLPTFLKNLNVEYITSPNFSIPDDLPKTEALINISRIVKASEQLSVAGLNVIPHLNATHERHWQYWASFLKEHSHIKYVAKEFQTGLAAVKTARWHLAKLHELEKRIGRRLHLYAVGGRRHMELMLQLGGFTIVDSRPFFQTVHRQVLTMPNGKWNLQRMPVGALLDGRLAANINTYRQGIADKLVQIRKKPPQSSEVRIVSSNSSFIEPTRFPISEAQYELWPSLELKITA